MTDIIREIEDEVQQDSIKEFVQKYLALIVGALVAITLGIAGYLWWQNEQGRQALRDASAFGLAIQAFQNGDTDGSFSQLADLGKASNGYALLSQFELASQQQQSGNIAQAVGTWAAISDNDGFAQPYRDLAMIYAAMAQINDGDFAGAIASTAKVDPLSPGLGAKAVELGALATWESGDLAGALTEFESLKLLLESAPLESQSRAIVDLATIETFIEHLEAAR